MPYEVTTEKTDLESLAVMLESAEITKEVDGGDHKLIFWRIDTTTNIAIQGTSDMVTLIAIN